MALKFNQWVDKIKNHIKQNDGVFSQKIINELAKRIEKNLNRIAQARIAEGSLNQNLSFTVSHDINKKIFIIRPSDAILFKKLEFGEFDENGVMKNPPHSIIKEWQAVVYL